MSEKRLLRAKDPIDLLNQVFTANENGEDLHAQLFVEEGLLCQWMAAGGCLYEYRLIEAGDLEEYELQVRTLSLLGYDTIFNRVHWKGKLVQWMHRWNEGGVKREDEAGLVETLQEEVRIESAAMELGTRHIRLFCRPIPELLVIDGVVIS